MALPGSVEDVRAREHAEINSALHMERMARCSDENADACEALGNHEAAGAWRRIAGHQRNRAAGLRNQQKEAA